MTLADDVAAIAARSNDRAGADWTEVRDIVTQLEADKSDLLGRIAQVTRENHLLRIQIAGEPHA